MFKVLDLPASDDISQFSRLLWQKKISHRIHRADDRQILVVSGQDQALLTEQLFAQWRRGEVQPDTADSSDVSAFFSGDDFMGGLVRAFTRTPLSLLTIVACIVFWLIAPLEEMSGLARAMLYPDFSFGTSRIVLSRVLENFTFMTFTKMLSPIFLHGGLLHLAFNMLWFWEFGRRIEFALGSLSLVMLVIFVALVSNTAQYLYGGYIYFGGMSGVVYGLFAYIWMWQLIAPYRRLGLPIPLIAMLLLSLLVLTLMDLEFIADEAHVGGLMAGIFYGVGSAAFDRFIVRPQRS